MVEKGLEKEEELTTALLTNTPVKKVKEARFQIAQVDKEDKDGDGDGQVQSFFF